MGIKTKISGGMMIEKDGVLWVDDETLLVFIDLETGGFSVEQNPVLSIATCLPSVNRKFEPSIWYLYPDPGFWVHRRAAAVNGYDPSTWEELGATSADEALDAFVEHLTDLENEFGAESVALCAHNATFDRRFLIGTLQQHGWDTDETTWRWFCTKRSLQTHQWDLGYYGPFGLESCCSAFRIKSRSTHIHDAAEDTVLGSKLVLSLWKRNMTLIEI